MNICDEERRPALVACVWREHSALPQGLHFYTVSRREEVQSKWKGMREKKRTSRRFPDHRQPAG